MTTKFFKHSDSAHVVHLFDLNRTEFIRKIGKSMFKKKFEESMNLCFSDNVEEPSSLFWQCSVLNGGATPNTPAYQSEEEVSI